MIDLFMIALMILACVVSPKDAKRIAIDYYDVKSGRAQTLEVERVEGGFLLHAPQEAKEPPRRIQALGEGVFSFEMPGDRPPKIDLREALAAIEKSKDAVTTFSLEQEPVRLTRTPGLPYLRPAARVEGPLVVVRALGGLGARFEVPNTKPGEGDFAGWEEYETHWEVFAHQAASLKGGHGSPAEVAIRFFTSLFRGDDDWHGALSPRMEPKLRAKLLAGLPERVTDLKRFVGRAKISKTKALKLESKPLRGIPQALEKFFGSYEVLLFGEGNTSATDIFLTFERVEGRWYLKGIGSRFTEFLFKEDPREEGGK